MQIRSSKRNNTSFESRIHKSHTYECSAQAKPASNGISSFKEIRRSQAQLAPNRALLIRATDHVLRDRLTSRRIPLLFRCRSFGAHFAWKIKSFDKDPQGKGRTAYGSGLMMSKCFSPKPAQISKPSKPLTFLNSRAWRAALGVVQLP